MNRKDFIEEMEKAALLEPGNPIRQEVETKIAGQGDWARKTWIEILSSDEQLRILSRNEHADPVLKSTLLQIPDNLRKARVIPKQFFAIIPAAVAAVLIIIYMALFHEPDSDKIEMLVSMTVNDHLNDRHVEYKTKQPSSLSKLFKDKINYPVVIPELGPSLNLIGARGCSVGTNKLVYTLWENKFSQYSLFQFKLSDFGISLTANTAKIKPKGHAFAGTPCEVLFWTDRDYGFILVADRGEYLNPKITGFTN